MLLIAIALSIACFVGIAHWFRHEAELSIAYATWALALFTFVLAVGIPFTILDATKEREESSRQFLEQEQDRFYAQLDSTYLQIQKLIIDYPHLGDPATLLGDSGVKPEHRVQYDAFAFIVWNFIESIHDFTHKGGDSPQPQSKTEMLSDTWSCILEYEGTRHLQWFLSEENEKKFKKSFREYIKAEHRKWNTVPSSPQADQR